MRLVRTAHTPAGEDLGCSQPDPLWCPQYDTVDDCLACARWTWCDIVDEPAFCTDLKTALELPKDPPHQCEHR